MQSNDQQLAVEVSKLVNEHRKYANSFKKDKTTGLFQRNGKGRTFTAEEKASFIERNLASISVQITGIFLKKPSGQVAELVDVEEPRQLVVRNKKPANQITEVLESVDSTLESLLSFGTVASRIVKTIRHVSDQAQAGKAS